MSKPASPTSTRNPILWGAYLACSWTWCIGMFLPILLLRDMGWAGFWIFAVPNVVGAAAMGWIIKTRSGSVQFVEKHARAIWWFSAITLAFHFYWILWITSFIEFAFPVSTRYLIGSIAFFLAFAFILKRSSRIGKTPHTALVLLVFSLAVLASTACTADMKEANTTLFEAAPQSMAPLWMLPVMLFGFLLCPYLDITFHHARQQLDSEKSGRLGFAIGFIGFFSFMILMTTRYAGVLAVAMDGNSPPVVTPWLAAGILLHILCQSFFTVHVHLERIRTVSGAQRKQPLLVVLLIIAGTIGFLAPRLPAYAGLSGGEVIYRLFMSAYGLLFPAYMLYRVIARRKSPTGGLSFMWIAIALALPLFWMGFIERHTIWLVPGMAMVFLGVIVQLKKRS